MGGIVPTRYWALAALGCAAALLAVAAGSSDPAVDDRAAERAHMVEEQIAARGIANPRVLAAMQRVPRHLFVAESERRFAYRDHPLPIDHGQTISQPYMVAVTTELIDPQPGDRVLEIGTGSGYQAAVLSEVVAAVYTIEIVPELAAEARERLATLGYDNVVVVTGDGYRGLADQAPFDGIVVTAAPKQVPQPLLDQLAVGGRLVIPVGGAVQGLQVHERTKRGIEARTLFGVRYVPMTGEAEERRAADR